MKWEHIVGLLGLVLLVAGHGMGLFYAPREVMMGDVGRILYVHVPTAWASLVMFLGAFVAAIGALWTGRAGWDRTMEAFVEVGVLLTCMLLFQGSIWARPTWGIWWTWDPRLTTSAIMVLLFGVVLLLRKLITDPVKRLNTTAIATIIAFVDVPIVYMSVKWWKTLHQDFSSPETVNETMVLALRIAAFGMLFVSIGLMGVRRRIGLAQSALDDAAPDLPDRAEPLDLGART